MNRDDRLALATTEDPVPIGADPIWQPYWCHVVGGWEGGWNPKFSVCYVAMPLGEPCFPVWTHLTREQRVALRT